MPIIDRKIGNGYIITVPITDSDTPGSNGDCAKPMDKNAPEQMAVTKILQGNILMVVYNVYFSNIYDFR